MLTVVTVDNLHLVSVPKSAHVHLRKCLVLPLACHAKEALAITHMDILIAPSAIPRKLPLLSRKVKASSMYFFNITGSIPKKRCVIEHQKV